MFRAVMGSLQWQEHGLGLVSGPSGPGRRASATRIFPRHCVFLLVIRKKIIPTILHIKHIKERGAAYQAYQGAWSGWLKELASNIHLISVTLDTFQLLSGWLKELAPANI